MGLPVAIKFGILNYAYYNIIIIRYNLSTWNESVHQRYIFTCVSLITVFAGDMTCVQTGLIPLSSQQIVLVTMATGFCFHGYLQCGPRDKLGILLLY